MLTITIQIKARFSLKQRRGLTKETYSYASQSNNLTQIKKKEKRKTNRQK